MSRVVFHDFENAYQQKRYKNTGGWKQEGVQNIKYKAEGYR